MPNFNFDCPHCGRAQTVTEHEYSQFNIFFETSETAWGSIGIVAGSVCCANEMCRQPTVSVAVRRWSYNFVNQPCWDDEEALLTKQLIPESSAKPQPDCIPTPIREDYIEACRIVDLSPKAAATLARRCLQGMIRDFCEIRKGSLHDEIADLKNRMDEGIGPKSVSDDSVEAIDKVRKIGNIGAHMEKDINLIVDVESDEARTLIELIETLFDEWYIEREKRKQRFDRIKAISDEKEAQKLIGKNHP